MNGDFKWIKDIADANFMYGGECYTITDEDIERLKKGEVLNFFVNMEYGCTLNYKKEVTNKEDTKKVCKTCEYYATIHGYGQCYGQKNAPKVDANEVHNCWQESWKEME